MTYPLTIFTFSYILYIGKPPVPNVKKHRYRAFYCSKYGINSVFML